MTMKQFARFFRQFVTLQPLVATALGCYLLFLAMTYLNAGGQGFWFVVAWPYAFLLAAQRIVGSPSRVAFVAAYLLGAVLVLLFAGALQGISVLNRHPKFAIGLFALAWYLPLGVLTLAAVGAAHLFGWPYGE